MEKSYIIIATKSTRKLPQGFRVHGEKAKTARLEKLIAEGWAIREIRPYRKDWVNV
jgi:hypothetical protein